MIRTLAVLLALSGALQANDWYVKSGADGDGTKAKPFGDIQAAVDKAVAGDVIHVVQGTYSGKLGAGYIVIDKPGLTLAGGYKDESFAERNPFLYPTFIAEDPNAKGSSFEGGYIRTSKGGGQVAVESTTVDGFWFDRKGQNKYDDKGNMGSPPLGVNAKPVIVFQDPDCHVLNCVFANTGFYALHIMGDGSSVENCLFVNVNECGIFVTSKNRKIGKGYPFHKVKIAHNSFVSVWNAYSLADSAGAAINHEGGTPGAHSEITDNIFHIAKGNSSSMGWAVTDVKNVSANRWVTFSRNSVSKFPGGFYYFYSKDLTKTVGLSKAADVSKAPVAEAKENDEEDPGFELDAEWLAAHEKSTCRWYPIAHVKTGALWTPKNEKVKGRGVQAAGPFPIVRGTLLASGGGDKTERPLTEFQEVDWATLWKTGDSLVDKPVKVKCYWCGWDQTYASGSGKKAVPYLAGADSTTHKILKLRDLAAMESGQTLKGYIRNGSAAAGYVDKEAKQPGPATKDSECNFSFFVYAVVRAPGAKLTTKGPQIVLEIETIKAE